MSNCGNLKMFVDEKTKLKSFVGDIRLLGVAVGELQLDVHPNYVPGKSPKDHPQFLVQYRPRGDRTSYEVGAAWVKPLRDGGEFISVTMDAPQFPRPINLAMFPPNADRKETDWRLQWSRPRGGEDQIEN